LPDNWELKTENWNVEKRQQAAALQRLRLPKGMRYQAFAAARSLDSFGTARYYATAAFAKVMGLMAPASLSKEQSQDYIPCDERIKRLSHSGSSMQTIMHSKPKR
jgi:hypothetical protein